MGLAVLGVLFLAMLAVLLLVIDMLLTTWKDWSEK